MEWFPHSSIHYSNYTWITVILTLFQKQIGFESQNACICMGLCGNLAQLCIKSWEFQWLYLNFYLQNGRTEKENLKRYNLAELSPFLLNYLREKTSHHLPLRQNAALTPKKTSVSQTKAGVKSTSEHLQHGTKNSSKGNLFPSQKSPSPAPITPLSQSRRDKLQEQHSSPSSSPRVRRKSPKVQANDRDKLSPLVSEAKINIDDPEDFPPMGSNRYKVKLIFPEILC